MSERPTDDTVDNDAEPTTEDGGATEEGASGPDTTREQVPAHVPPHLRDLFTKHEGSVAARPGFRNPSNKKSKAQRKKRKKKR